MRCRSRQSAGYARRRRPSSPACSSADRDAPEGEPVGEVHRAVERVDDPPPGPLEIGVGPSPSSSASRVWSGNASAEPLGDEPLAGEIGLGDQVGRPLLPGRDPPVRLPEKQPGLGRDPLGRDSRYSRYSSLTRAVFPNARSRPADPTPRRYFLWAVWRSRHRSAIVSYGVTRPSRETGVFPSRPGARRRPGPSPTSPCHAQLQPGVPPWTSGRLVSCRLRESGWDVWHSTQTVGDRRRSVVPCPPARPVTRLRGQPARP